MKNIFIDINILMDVFAERKPFFKNSLKIYMLGSEKKLNLFTSSNTITTLHYLLKKVISEDKTRQVLENIIENVNVIPIDKNIIKKSLKSKHKDFEDAIHIAAAQSINTMDCIITRDFKDYKFSEIDVFSPDEFLNLTK
ncbi:MAG: PIN domain-containing protein [Flavobacterium sp.]|nr:PIN domain-containing protein [Flavobacterium sp.]